MFVACYFADRQSALLQTVCVRHIPIHCAQSGSFPRQSFFSAGFINLYLLLHHLFLTYTFRTQTPLSPHLLSSDNFSRAERQTCSIAYRWGDFSSEYIGRSLKLIAHFHRLEGFKTCVELCPHFHVFFHCAMLKHVGMVSRIIHSVFCLTTGPKPPQNDASTQCDPEPPPSNESILSCP